MKRYRIYIILCTLLTTLVSGCMKEDMNEALRREAELNVRIGNIREWCTNANNELILLHSIVNAESTSDYIESISDLADGSGYTISFHKGGTITIKHGEKGDNGADGDDGQDGQNGQNGNNGQNGSGGSQGPDGPGGPDGPDGEKGPPGDTPLMGAAKDPADGVYYWTVSIGNTPADWLLDPEGNRLPVSPTPGITPKMSIAKDTDGEYYWQQTMNDKTDWVYDHDGNKLPAKAVDGKDSIFLSIDNSNPDYVVFTMTDFTTYKVAKKVQMSLAFLESGPVFFQRGKILDLSFSCQNIRTVSHVSGQWQSTVHYTENTSRGILTVEAPAAGDRFLPASETIVIKGESPAGEEIRAEIIVTLYYKFEIPVFSVSYVYDLLLHGLKVGEVCREYLPDYSDRNPATVVYPYDTRTNSYGPGLVIENGATIRHDGTGYMAPVTPVVVSNSILTEDGSNFTFRQPGKDGEPAGGTSGIRASLVTDVQGYSYRTVKIGSQYWMGENLKSTALNDGTPIPTGFTTSLGWMVQCGNSLMACQVDRATDANAPGALKYRNLYGVLYNQFVLSADVTPKGWHIPSKDEMDVLISFVNNDAGKLKSVATGNEPGSWLPDAPGVAGNNITGFTALPGNYVDGGNGSSGASETNGEWWTTDVKYRMLITYKSGSVAYNAIINQILGEACSIRCIRNDN